MKNQLTIKCVAHRRTLQQGCPECLGENDWDVFEQESVPPNTECHICSMEGIEGIPAVEMAYADGIPVQDAKTGVTTMTRFHYPVCEDCAKSN